MNKIILATILLSGCATHDLGPEWAPLEKVRGGDVPFGDRLRTLSVVIEDTVYVPNLDKWLDNHPEPLYTATLTHEQVHALRQKEMGVWRWLFRYLTDRDFMWSEEQLGWYAYLRYLYKKRMRIDVDGVVSNLQRYRNLNGPMVGEEEARDWVRDVLSGRWQPRSQ